MPEKPVVICKASRQSLKSFLVTVRNLGEGRGIAPIVLATLMVEDLPRVFYYSQRLASPEIFCGYEATSCGCFRGRCNSLSRAVLWLKLICNMCYYT